MKLGSPSVPLPTGEEDPYRSVDATDHRGDLVGPLEVEGQPRSQAPRPPGAREEARGDRRFMYATARRGLRDRRGPAVRALSAGSPHRFDLDTRGTTQLHARSGCCHLNGVSMHGSHRFLFDDRLTPTMLAVLLLAAAAALAAAVWTGPGPGVGAEPPKAAVVRR